MRERIAQVSVDPTLATAREDLLHRAGYNVRTFDACGELMFACMNQQFDLLIVGHSLGETVREQMRAAFRKFNAGAPIVQIIRSNESPGSADYAFNIEQDPAELMRLLAKILDGTDTEASARTAD
jgi:DNA-binding NtrC family response regulator